MMTALELWPFALLTLFIMLDGAATGFRAAAGRRGEIDKRTYFRRAIQRGTLAGALIAAVGAALALIAWLVVGEPFVLAAERATRAALSVYAPIVVIVATAIALWFAPNADLRTLVTVSILGPGTLLRPPFMLLGLIVGAKAGDHPALWLFAAYAAVTMLTLERWLGTRYAPQQR